MQWFQDEKMKHRVIGIAVLMSIALIVVPAMVKKSNQRLDRNLNLTLNLPPKPKYPAVQAPKPETLFKEMKVAQVKLQGITENQRPITVSKAESLSGQTMATRSVIQKSPMLPHTVVVAKVDKPIKRVVNQKPLVNTRITAAQRVVPVKPTVVAKAAMIQPKQQRVVAIVKHTAPVKRLPKSEIFAVQVASFAREDNAVSLVRSLQQKGFKASYDRQGVQYRVLVGELGQRHEAKYLQQRLASAAQLSGFIVKVG